MVPEDSDIVTTGQKVTYKFDLSNSAISNCLECPFFIRSIHLL